jgi:hypothetical protein
MNFDVKTFSDVANAVLALFTVVLAGATVWLAFATRRMASVSKEAFDLESRAYFVFRNFLFKFYVEKPEEGKALTKGHMKVGLLFGNPGKVLINYEVKSIRATYAGTTIDNPTFKSMKGVIYPNDQTVFWYGVIPNVDISAFPNSGIVEYTVEYYSVFRKGLHKTQRKIEYIINSVEPVADFDWLYLEESDTEGRC